MKNITICCLLVFSISLPIASAHLDIGFVGDLVTVDAQDYILSSGGYATLRIVIDVADTDYHDEMYSVLSSYEDVNVYVWLLTINDEYLLRPSDYSQMATPTGTTGGAYMPYRLTNVSRMSVGGKKRISFKLKRTDVKPWLPSARATILEALEGEEGVHLSINEWALLCIN